MEHEYKCQQAREYLMQAQSTYEHDGLKAVKCKKWGCKMIVVVFCVVVLLCCCCCVDFVVDICIDIVFYINRLA